MQKEVGSLIVGVLALQGGVNEHVHHIESIGCKSILVKNALDLLYQEEKAQQYQNYLN